MSKNVLENGVYSVTQPISSSITSGGLMAENELFDQVYIKETNSKTKSLTLSFQIAQAADEKDHQTINDNDFYKRKISSAELNPSRVHHDEEATSCCGKKTKHCIWNIVVLISLIAVVGLYSLGIVFFYTNVPENEDFFDDKLRERLVNQLELCLELEDLSSGTVTQTPDTCFSYTDDVCLSALQSIANRSGIHVTGNSIMVQRNLQAGSVDPDFIFGVVNSHPSISQECRIVGLPLFCQYFYPICNPNDGSIISVTEEECFSVTEGECQQALEFARDIETFNIPDCREFASASSVIVNVTAEVTAEEVATEVDSTEVQNTTVLNCHDQFDARCGMCVPSCNRFSETSEERQRTIDIFFIIAALTCVIGGIFVILVSTIRRDIMFDFPSVFIIYMTIVMMVISILVLISYGARDHLYCTHPELPLAYENPTFFCQFSGFVLHAGVLQIVLYWLLHLIHLFLKFIFPFAIRRFNTKKWKRIFHFTELILIILFTVLAPIYIVLGSKYYPYGYPPVLCVPNANLTFYTLVLPIILMLCLGTSIIVLMLWRLQMRTEFVKRNASRISRLLRLTTAEFKVVILLCFFLTFGVVNAIYFSLYSRNYEFVLSLALEYFYCQKDGYNATCETHKQEIETYRYQGLANTSYFLMGLLTISNFLFAIHVKQLKGQVRRLSIKAASRIRSTLNQSRGGANQSKQSRES